MRALVPLLAGSGLRRRRLPMLLTAAVVACAVATATVALALGDLADGPWDRTFGASNGAHVLGMGGPGTDWEPVFSAPGVAATAGPYETTFSALVTRGRQAPALVREVPARAPRLERPLLVSGRWPRSGEILLERSLANELRLRAGENARLGGVPVRIAGIAVTSSHEEFPASQPGLVLARRETIAAVTPAPSGRGSLVAIRLRDPATAPAFAMSAAGLASGKAHFQPWQKRRADVAADTRTSRVVLSFFTVFLLVLAAAVVATLVSARVIERARTVAQLVAIGCTPRQATTVFAAEQVGVGAIGAVAGGLLGTLIAPSFVLSSSTLLQAAPDRAGLGAAVVAGAAALVWIGVVTTLTAWRVGRGAVVDGLRGSRLGRARPSRAARGLDRLGLPAAAVVAARDAFSPRARALLSILALSLTVATVVCILAMEATLDASQVAARATDPLPAPPGAPGLPPPYSGGSADGAEDLRPVVYGLSLALIVVGLANLLATVLLSVRERTRDLSLLRALGAAARQVAAILLGAQAMAASVAVCLGIPLGLLAFRLAYAADNGSASGVASPPAWQLAALAPAVVLVVVLTCLPAAVLANRVRPGAGLRTAQE